MFETSKVAIVASFALLGCSGTPEISVERKWSESIRNYSLVPIYPMREDVFVGSVRVSASPNSKTSLSSRSLGYEDISGVLSRSLKAMPQFAKTGTLTFASGTGTQSFAQPQSSVSTTTGRSDRLRLAGLPGISIVQLSEADVGKSGLGQLVGGALGISVRDERNLNLDLIGIETVEIDDVAALVAMRSTVLRKIHDVASYRDGICASIASLEDPQGDKAQISMVTRVFYARGLRYTYGENLSAALSSGEGAQEASNTAANSAQGSAQSGTGDGATAVLPANAGPIGAVIGRNAGLSSTDVFERPMAFGVQVLSFSIKDLGLSCNPKTRAAVYDGSLGAYKIPPDVSSGEDLNRPLEPTPVLGPLVQPSQAPSR